MRRRQEMSFRPSWLGGSRQEDGVVPQKLIETDPEREKNYFGPQREALR